MRIAVDAMGGDYAPGKIVEGACDYYKENSNDTIILVGDQRQIIDILKKYHGGINKRIEIVHTTEKIEMDDKVNALRIYPKASVILAAKMVKEDKADAMVALGNTAVAMASATIHIGRLDGVDRPPIAIVLPTINNRRTVLLDGGAVVDCSASILGQFTILGAIYAQKVLKISQPRVMLLSVGEEETKGNKIVLETANLLRHSVYNNSIFTFEGMIESRDIFSDRADVIVTDGFSGNIALKAIEGFLDYIKVLTKRDKRLWPYALMAYPLFHSLRSKINCEEQGGAPLLGLDGVCIIGHGNSKAKSVAKAIETAKRTVKSGITEATKTSLNRFK